MTNQEAIYLLRGLKARAMPAEKEALDMAIEALQPKTAESGYNTDDFAGYTQNRTKNDNISRQDAIDALAIVGDKQTLDKVAERIYNLPSAQPDLVNNSQGFSQGDLISRQDAQKITAKVLSGYITDDVREAVEAIDAEIGELPSAQPDESFEWCTDCREYDQEAHCCHRWTKQIRKTIAELEESYPQEMREEIAYWKKRAEESEQRWIPCEIEYPVKDGEYLVSWTNIYGKQIVCIDEYNDGEWDTYLDWVTAWMPLPEPYKGDES